MTFSTSPERGVFASCLAVKAGNRNHHNPCGRGELILAACSLDIGVLPLYIHTRAELGKLGR